MRTRRIAAIVALALMVAAVVLVGFDAGSVFPRGLAIAALLVAGAAAGWVGIRRRGHSRTVWLAAGAALVVAAVVVAIGSGLELDTLGAIACLVASLAFAKRAFRVHVRLPAAPRPSRPVVIWNPRSGGGKALAANLAEEARARGIEPIELSPGDDLVTLVRDAVAGGADGLAAAGGDGTQALVAAIAAEHDLPFACIPAGTRNHFALDLGVDRDDVVGALDAFVAGGERRVDLAEVNGRTFVNNVSLGLYAEAVQREGYRDAKLRTILDTVPDVMGGDGSHAPRLGWSGPDGAGGERAAVILVSNNIYRLGRVLGSGTRPRIDDGLLGISVMEAPAEGGIRPGPWHRWSAPAFEVTASGPVPAGVNGEALTLETPVRFAIRAGVLRVRIAPHHPGASPSAAEPEGMAGAIRALWRIAAGAGA